MKGSPAFFELSNPRDQVIISFSEVLNLESRTVILPPRIKGDLIRHGFLLLDPSPIWEKMIRHVWSRIPWPGAKRNKDLKAIRFHNWKRLNRSSGTGPFDHGPRRTSWCASLRPRPREFYIYNHSTPLRLSVAVRHFASCLCTEGWTNFGRYFCCKFGMLSMAFPRFPAYEGECFYFLVPLPEYLQLGGRDLSRQSGVSVEKGHGSDLVVPGVQNRPFKRTVPILPCIFVDEVGYRRIAYEVGSSRVRSRTCASVASCPPVHRRKRDEKQWKSTLLEYNLNGSRHYPNDIRLKLREITIPPTLLARNGNEAKFWVPIPNELDLSFMKVFFLNFPLYSFASAILARVMYRCYFMKMSTVARAWVGSVDTGIRTLSLHLRSPYLGFSFVELEF